jgi:hypothetical protein
MFCAMCGAPNEEQAAFCGNCGVALTPEASRGPTPERSQGAEPGAMVEAVQDIVDEAVPPPEPEESTALPPSTSGVEALPHTPPIRPVSGSPLSIPTNGMAIASLILGIGGLTVVPLIGSILAIILGNMARKEIHARPDESSGEGMAKAGLVMGWIGVGLTVLAACGVAVAACALFAFAGNS